MWMKIIKWNDFFKRKNSFKKCFICYVNEEKLCGLTRLLCMYFICIQVLWLWPILIVHHLTVRSTREDQSTRNESSCSHLNDVQTHVQRKLPYTKFNWSVSVNVFFFSPTVGTQKTCHKHWVWFYSSGDLHWSYRLALAINIVICYRIVVDEKKEMR